MSKEHIILDRNAIKYKGKKKSTVLLPYSKVLFRISIENKLDNGFCFKGLNAASSKKFNDFINKTVGIGLTVSDVEKKYKRKSDGATVEIDGVKYEEIHFGQNKSPFRIFGYYKDSYFVLKKIDPKHRVHR